jgi:SRSO17 transposase
MECTFDERKQQLERECVVKPSHFEACLDRLDDFMIPFVQSLCRQEQGDHATEFVSGLCSDLECKNAESIAYHFELDRKTMQNFIGQSKWNDMPLRAELTSQIANQLGEANGIIILDPSAFVKSGKDSVGVARQWCGRLGKVDNCQLGLYLAYASSKGHALVDGEIYLPKEWTDDKLRMKKAGVPKNKQNYKTRHVTFLELLARHGKDLPHQWLTGDDEMGRPIGFRRILHSLGEQYMLAVPRNTKINVVESNASETEKSQRKDARSSIQISKWVSEQTEDKWVKIDVRDTEKGPLIVELMKCQVETGYRSKAGIAKEVAIAIRYIDRDQSVIKQDYYLSNAGLTTTESEFARVAKAEHRIEECFDRGKGEAGMADYEVRNWTGWHHHQTMSLIASWFLNIETRRAEKKDTGDNIQPGTSGSRVDHTHPVRMRFIPRRITKDYETSNTKSTRKALSLA